MASSIYDLVVNISTDIASLQEGMNKATRSITSFQDAVLSAGKSLAGLAGITFSVAGLAEVVTSTIQATEQMGRLAIQVGTTAAELSQLVAPAILSGTSIDAVALASDKFSKNMLLAAQGNQKMIDSLGLLGFSAKDAAGFLKEPVEGLRKFALALAQFQDDGTKAAIVMTVFGRGAQEMLPFLKQLAESGLGVATVTNAQAAEAKQLTDAWRAMALQGAQLRSNLVGEITPAITALINMFVAATSGSGSLKEAVKGLIADGTIRQWASDAAKQIAILADAITDSINVFKAMGSTIAYLVIAIADFVRILVGANTAAHSLPGGEAFNNAVADIKKAIAETTTAYDAMKKDWQTPLSTKFQDALAETAKNAALASFRIAEHADALKKLPTPANAAAAAVTDLSKVLDAYYRALANVAKAATDAQAKLELQATSNALDDLKRMYGRGIVDFQQYWDAKTAVEQTALGIQEQQLRDDIDTQSRLVSALQDAYAKFTTSGQQQALPLQGQLEGAAKAAAPLLEAFAKLIAAQGALTVVQEKGTQIGKNYIEELTQANAAILSSVKSLDEQIQKQDLANASIGLAASQIELLIASKLRELAVDAQLHGISQEVIDDYNRQAAAREKLATSLKFGEDLKAQLDLVKQAMASLSTGLVDIVQHGLSGFRNLWDSFKAWGLKALADIAAQKIVVSILSSIAPGLAGAAANSFAGAGNPLSTLLGIGGGGGSSGGLLGGLLGDLPSFGTALENISGGFATFTTLLGEGAGLIDAGSAALAGLGTSFSALLGPIGLIAAIGIPLLSSLFKSGGGPKEGGSATSGDVSGLTALDAGRFFTPNTSDTAVADTITNVNAQFNALLAGLGGAINKGIGFALGFDTDPRGTAQSRVSGGVTVGGQQVFQQQNLNVGRDNASLQAALSLEAQRAVLAALKASALPADIAKLFSSLDVGTLTADQITAVEKTAATYKSINDAIATLPSDIQEHFTQMLDGTDQLANSILVVVGVIQAFGGAISGLGPKLEALDPASITAFVDALGGAQAAASSFSYLAANFLTSTQKMDLATATLVTDFTKLGITAIPQTHQQFLDLLNSFDLTTDAGRQMYAGVLALSQLFVQVHGTADQAAGSLTSVSDALSQAAQSAQSFFQQNFYSAAEQAASKLADEQKQLADAQNALNIAIPTTVAGFRQLIESIDQTTPAGKAMYAALIVLAPAIFDIAKASTSAATQITSAAAIIQSAGAGLDVAQTASDKFVSKFAAKITSLANLSTGDLGTKLGIQIPLYTSQINQLQTQLASYLQSTGGNIDIFAVQLQTEIAALGTANAKMIADLAQFTTLKAQYGASVAEQLVALQNTYDQQQRALRGNADALAALQTIFQQNWQNIISGVATGVTGTLDQLAKLRQGILDYLNSLKLGDLSVLSPQQKLAEAAKQFQAELAKAQGGDQGALGDVTKFADAYLQLARQFYASGSQYTDIYSNVTQGLQGLVTPPTGQPGFTDVAVPGTAPGSTPTTDVTTGGQQLATASSVRELRHEVATMLATLIASGEDLALAERQVIAASGANNADAVAAAVARAASIIVNAQLAARRK